MIIKKSRGFLLIEVLITVVIVTASIIFINQAFSSSLRATSLANTYNKAILLLEDKIFDIESEPATEEGGSYSVEEQLMNETFTLQQEYLPLEKEDIGDEYSPEEISLMRFQFLLKWFRQNREREIDILTYVPIAENEEE